jgi:hypothetical protein
MKIIDFITKLKKQNTPRIANFEIFNKQGLFYAQTALENYIIREPFEKFVDWRQCAAVIQR